MNAMLVYTASSCGVRASGIRLTAPTVPWMVSSSVRPVKTRMVTCFSWAVSVPQDGMSLDTGTFSGSQKLPVSRSHTSASFSSDTRFQLIADTRSISLIFSVTMSSLRSLCVLENPAGYRGRTGSQHAGDAVLHLGPLEGHLTQPDVVQRLDPLAPRVDLRLVQVPGGGGVLEEQRQRQALVHVLGGRGIGVDDLLVPDLVRILVVLEVVVAQVRRRIVDATDLAFLADLDLRRHRVDRRGGVVDVRDRPGGWYRLQVLVVDAVPLHGRLQLAPVVLRRDVHARVGEQPPDPLRLRLPHPIGVLVEVLARGVLGLREALEVRAPLDRDLVRRPDGVVHDGVEVHVREVDALVGAVVDPLPGA